MAKNNIILNMIVKNESHVIEETLTCLTNKLEIVYYFITDTGSTDNTIEIIENFFNKKNILGKVISHAFTNCECHGKEFKKYPFFHFGHNRSYSLQECIKETQKIPHLKENSYILVFDADDLIVGDIKIPKLTADSYMLVFGKEFTYKRTQVFKNDPEIGWRYEYPLHEYPTCNKYNRSESSIEGDYHVESRRLGDRNKNPNKYRDDAKVFEIYMEDHPNDERAVFYCAQSYFDGQEYAKAIPLYQKRIDLGKWYEEVFYSYMKLGEAKDKIGYPWAEVEKTYLDGYNFCKIRGPEVLYRIAHHYRLEKDYKNAYKYAKMGSTIKFPKQCVLFIFKYMYDFTIHDEMAISAFELGKHYEAYSIYKRLLTDNLILHSEVERVKRSFQVIEQKLKERDKKYICFYCDLEVVSCESQVAKLIEESTKLYKVIVVGNSVGLSHVENILTFNEEEFKLVTDRVEFEYLILYNSVNFINSKNLKQVKSKYIYLLQNDHVIKNTLKNRTIIGIYNYEYLNTTFRKINKICCLGDKVANKLSNDYKLDKQIITIIDPNDILTYPTLYDDTKHHYNFKQSMESKNNHLEYIEPESIKYLIKNNLPFSKKVIHNHYDKMIKANPNKPEHYFQYALICLQLDDISGANFNLDKALSHLDNKLKTHKEFRDVISVYKANIMNKNGKYKESYDLANEMLNKNNISNSLRIEFEEIRDINVDHIKSNYLIYPTKKIIDIKNNVDEKAKNKAHMNVMFSITTCKRFDLFEKTINSFINCCSDVDKIDYWLCVDDNSNEKDRFKMKKLYPFFNFIMKGPKEKGHFASMNIIYKHVTENNVDYLLHMEDDWQFVQERDYITDSLRVFKENKKIGQVLFNRNYAEIEHYKTIIGGGIIQKTRDDMRYVIHEYYEPGTREHQIFEKKYAQIGQKMNKTISNCAYWPHFSFRPSVVKVDVYKTVGVFYNTGHFEMQYAKEYVQYGFISAFLDTFSCIHIGKKTWEKTTDNAYTLNQMGQFALKEKFITINVHSKNNNANTWRKFKDNSIGKLPFYTRYNDKDVKHLSELEKKIFNGNDFNYIRKIINPVSKYIDLLRENNNLYIMFLHEDIMFHDEFESYSKQLIKKLEKNNYDLISLNKYVENNKDNLEIIKSDFPLTDLNSLGIHVISIKGAQKILKYINDHGIKTQNFLKDIKLNKYVLNKKLFYDNSEKQVVDPSTLFEGIPGYDFYSQLDSYGNDIGYFHEKTVRELHELCEEHGGIGFNTLGYIKKTVTDEKDFIYLINTTSPQFGFYKKIDNLSDNQEIVNDVIEQEIVNDQKT